jgi:NAD(P)-dependent dehydrogenase (short-subunit alcohol dehydrogenase family)
MASLRARSATARRQDLNRHRGRFRYRESKRRAVRGRGRPRRRRRSQRFGAGAGAGAARRVDVADEKETRALAAAVVAQFGRIDVLFNNAGISGVGDLEETTLELWSR